MILAWTGSTTLDPNDGVTAWEVPPGATQGEPPPPPEDPTGVGKKNKIPPGRFAKTEWE